MKNNKDNNQAVITRAEREEAQMSAVWNGTKEGKEVSGYERMVASGVYGMVI